MYVTHKYRSRYKLFISCSVGHHSKVIRKSMHIHHDLPPTSSSNGTCFYSSRDSIRTTPSLSLSAKLPNSTHIVQSGQQQQQQMAQARHQTAQQRNQYTTTARPFRLQSQLLKIVPDFPHRPRCHPQLQHRNDNSTLVPTGPSSQLQ